MDIKPNFHNAETGLKAMHSYFASKSIQGQAQVVVPPSIELHSAAHYRFLFYSCLLDYGMRSRVLHENLLLLYEQHPYLFSPSYIMNNYSDTHVGLAALLRSYTHVRYPNECARRWIGLSILLHTNWNDDPQEMFKGKSTYYEYKEAINQVKGLGQKTGGFLLRMLIDNEMLKPSDGIAEIPIDRHDVDLSIWLGVLSGFTSDEIKRSKNLIKLLSDTWVQAANHLSISPSLADRYLWIIGSEFCVSRNCVYCPIKQLCKRREICINEKNIYCSTDV